MRKRIALLLLTLVLTAPGCAVIGEMVVDLAVDAVFGHDHDDSDRNQQPEERRFQRRRPRRGC